VERMKQASSRPSDTNAEPPPATPPTPNRTSVADALVVARRQRLERAAQRLGRLGLGQAALLVQHLLQRRPNEEVLHEVDRVAVDVDGMRARNVAAAGDAVRHQRLALDRGGAVGAVAAALQDLDRKLLAGRGARAGADGAIRAGAEDLAAGVLLVEALGAVQLLVPGWGLVEAGGGGLVVVLHGGCRGHRALGPRGDCPGRRLCEQRCCGYCRVGR